MEKLIRPFPWKCGTCREKAVVPIVVDYVGDVGHDGNYYSIRIPNLEILQCEKCQTRMLLDDASAKIDDALRQHLGLLTPDEIQTKRLSLGLSQQELADAIQVDCHFISGWESGMFVQSRAMNRQLLAFFNLPAVRDYYRKLDGKAPQVASNAAELEMSEAVT